MKRYLLILLTIILLPVAKSQTPLTEAIDFHVKTIEGIPIYLFPLLDTDNIVVIDFFSTTCGPCQEYAPDFQEAYEEFGENQSNVFFMGINWGDDNDGVHEFDSVFGLTFPSVSGTQGGGDNVYLEYEVQSYPTVIVIKPDHQIVEQYINPPTAENIIDAVIEAGGLYVGLEEPDPLNLGAVLYPNPASDRINMHFNLERSGMVQFEILDVTGMTVERTGKIWSQKGSHKFELPVDQLQNGLYFLRFLLNDQTIHTSKLMIVQH